MNQLAIDYTTGEALKRRGQRRALENAGPDWADQACALLKTWAAQQTEPFAIEDFRVWALANGLPPPRSNNAFGSLPRIATARLLIRWTGQTRKARSLATHAHPVRTYLADAFNAGTGGATTR